MVRGCILMMTDKEISKFLSLVLRHAPEKIDLPLDKQGWAETQVLLRKAKKLVNCLMKQRLSVLWLKTISSVLRFQPTGSALGRPKGILSKI
ncbi:MAG: RNA 2'-phosphotransferase [Acetobacter orientalis]|uniref:RNA 2'-phosphotransferase n=1 Tax=Acetobacter orientalis TaxID=146474 RepID=UPI0039EAF896